ncbi:MAG: phosphoribosylglycinamide formyltransferase [Bacteroidetes bacterium]|nr:phosphoribosylglycinamide formyltransferase [Bacteroidota bacterium]
MMTNIAILASGSGTNAQRISEYFAGHPAIKVKMVLSNKPDAYVLTRARQLGIPHQVFDRRAFYETNIIAELLKKSEISYIILAGFLWLIPVNLLETYPHKIINIHPALLPKYGGKGMYGERVHEAVIRAGERESGISIHYVNDKYDEGDIIFQARCPVMSGDTPATLAERIHELEYRWYPEVIEKIVMNFK